MIKVLLLDDEKLALEYLEKIVSWQMYGFEIVGTMTDAEQALKNFRRTRPDLVISDVCMYGMDGLDFAAAIREIDQNTHILFLTGYKNFKYVQEAIRLGIDDYLLKSDVDEEIFLAKILRIKEKIEKEQQKKQYTEGVILKELFLNNKEEKAYKEILSEAEYIRLHKKYYYLIVSRRRVPEFLRGFLPGSCQDSYMDEAQIYHIIKQQAEVLEISTAAVFALNDWEMIIVLEINGTVSQKEIYDKIYRLSSTAFNRLNRAEPNEYNMFYYCRSCAVRQFGRLYRENRRQMDFCYVKKEPQLLEFELDQCFVSENSGVQGFSADEICEALRRRDMEKEDTFVQCMMIAVEQEDCIVYLWCLKEMMVAMKRMEEILKNTKNVREFTLAESADKFDLRRPSDTIAFIRYKFEEIARLYQEISGFGYSRSVQEALNYIQGNYQQEELSTNIIAKQVNLSTSWLSTKFKEEVGVGLNDYLNNVRVFHAKKLFDEKDYMIYEVSEKVGFSSSQYFSKIFKQTTGMTPNEYKRACRDKIRGD